MTSSNIEYYAKEDLNILLSKAFNDLKKLLEVIPEKNSRKSTDIVIDELLTYCNHVYKYPLKKADYKQLRTYLFSKSPRTFIQALNNLREYPKQIKSKDADSFYRPIYSVISNDTVSEAIFSIGEELEGLKKHYAKSDDDIFYKDPPFMYLVEYAERYSENFWEFIDHVESAIAKMSSFENDSIDELA